MHTLLSAYHFFYNLHIVRKPQKGIVLVRNRHNWGVMRNDELAALVFVIKFVSEKAVSVPEISPQSQGKFVQKGVLQCKFRSYSQISLNSYVPVSMEMVLHRKTFCWLQQR